MPRIPGTKRSQEQAGKAVARLATESVAALEAELAALRAEVERLRAALEARRVYAPKVSTERLVELLAGHGFHSLPPIQRRTAEWELMVRRALLKPKGEPEKAGGAK